MVIVHVTTVHPSSDVRVFQKECRSLVQAGFDVHVVCRELPPLAAHIEQIHYHVIGSYTSRWARMLLGIPKAFISSLHTHARVVHIHDPELLPITLLWRILGKEVVYDIHEDYVTSIRQKRYLPSLVRSPLAAIIGMLEKSAANGCRKIIAEKYYAERFPDAISVLNYPILEDSIHEESSPALYLSKQYRWCLYSGVITEDRGAFNHLQVLTADKNIGLCMIGRCDGQLYERLFAKIVQDGIELERLVIVGRDKSVPKKEMDAIVRGHDWLAALAVFPKTDHYMRKELTKLFEYMRDGIPIIASDFPMWRELIEECGCGLLVNPGSIGEITAALEWMISNPVASDEMRANGRRVVREKYDWQNEAEKLIELYRNMDR